VRLFLGGFDLTPTYKDVAGKFSVSYILNLVLVDEDDRRYFKQREIFLWRKQEGKGPKKVSKKQFQQEEKAGTETLPSKQPSSESSETQSEPVRQ
jgi:hypothetical protein